jgi:hypothetical protein
VPGSHGGATGVKATASTSKATTPSTPKAPAATPKAAASATKAAASTPRATTSSGSAATIARDPHGRIARSEAAKDAFLRQTGFPHGRPGYIVDHRIPLACGGADAPSNMQWQTVAEAKAKDKIERAGCR